MSEKVVALLIDTPGGTPPAPTLREVITAAIPPGKAEVLWAREHAGGRSAFWHDPDDYSHFRAAPVDLPWGEDEETTFVNKQHMLEVFADEVSSLLGVPRCGDGYNLCIQTLENLTGRNL